METIYYSLDAKRLTVCGEAAGRRASGGQETVCYAFVPRPRRPAGGLHRPGQPGLQLQAPGIPLVLPPGQLLRPVAGKAAGDLPFQFQRSALPFPIFLYSNIRTRRSQRNYVETLFYLQTKKKRSALTDRLCWHYLSSRPVSRQVFSAQVSLTAVFGMGTGGPSPQSTPTYFPLKRKVSKRNSNNFLLLTVLLNDKSLYPFSSSLSREK